MNPDRDSLGLINDARALDGDDPENAATVCEKRAARAAERDRHELAAAYAQASALYLIVAELRRII